MANKSVQKIEMISGLDDLFKPTNMAALQVKTDPIEVSLSEIDSFPDHPFKVLKDEAMADLVQSIKERGLITALSVTTFSISASSFCLLVCLLSWIVSSTVLLKTEPKAKTPLSSLMRFICYFNTSIRQISYLPFGSVSVNMARFALVLHRMLMTYCRAILQEQCLQTLNL